MSAPRGTELRHSQNFLHNPRLVNRLLRESSIGPDDLVVEIGPGKGIITERLARMCRQVLAIEKDPGLAHELRQRLATVENVAVFEADAVGFPLPITNYKVFASIPFNVTAAIIGQLTNGPTAPDDAFLVTQAEAAARFLGRPRESLAALLLKPWFEPTIVHRFRRSDFIPAPRVDVVMLRLKKRGPPLVEGSRAQRYRDFVTALFTSWQPTVAAALTRIDDRPVGRKLATHTGLNLNRPPTMIPFEDWLMLFDAYFRATGGRRDRIRGAESRLRDQQSRLEKVHRTRVAARSRSAAPS